jgi:Leucine-rich repeat (LRR) protein
MLLLFGFTSSLLGGVGAVVLSNMTSLYNESNGDNWTNNTNWLSGDPCTNNWYGISCNSSDQITAINLQNNHLTGVITTNLTGSYLSSLTTLDLSGNLLGGTIPSEIISIANLTSLQLHHNYDLTTNDVNTQNHIVTSNNDQGAYSYIVNTNISLIQTNALEALYNATSGVRWISNSNWKVGNPCTNNWYGVTCNSDGLVTELALQSNNLVGNIPTEIGNLTQLTSLNLRGNQLTGAIPPEIGNLTQLTILYLYDNQLTGSIPTQIGNLTQLTIFLLNNNTALFADSPTQTFINSIPNNNGGYLYIRESNLIYPQIAALESLYTSTDGANWLVNTNWNDGGNPCSWYGVTCINYNITELSLRANGLKNSLPDNLGNLEFLTYLDLSSNQLTGTIPASLENLVYLNTILLTSNMGLYAENSTILYIDGATAPGTYDGIVSSNANVAQRNALISLYNTTNGNNWVDNTSWLSGDHCNWFGIVCTDSNVTSLSLPFNDLNGTLPTNIGDLTNLTEFLVNNNLLIGELPSSIIQLTNINNPNLNLNTNTCLYSNNVTVQNYIASKSGDTYENFLASQIGCQANINLVPVIMYLLN